MKKILFVVLGFGLLAVGCNRMENSLNSYKEATKFCGENNTRQTDWSDGSATFDCKDYSKVK